MLSMQTWWNRSNATRVEIVLGVILIAARVYLTYKRSKDVNRPLHVRRIERNIAIALWTFIALAVLVLFLMGRFH
jgi:hypothetical protein